MHCSTACYNAYNKLKEIKKPQTSPGFYRPETVVYGTPDSNAEGLSQPVRTLIQVPPILVNPDTGSCKWAFPPDMQATGSLDARSRFMLDVFLNS